MASHASEGAGGDWNIRSGKDTGKVILQGGGGEVQFLGGGAIKPSFAGYGPTKDWIIRAGETAGSVQIQDQGGLTKVGGDMEVKKDLKLGGHLFLTSAGGSSQTLESRLEEMETRMQELTQMLQNMYDQQKQ